MDRPNRGATAASSGYRNLILLSSSGLAKSSIKSRQNASDESALGAGFRRFCGGRRGTLVSPSVASSGPPTVVLSWNRAAAVYSSQQPYPAASQQMLRHHIPSYFGLSRQTATEAASKLRPSLTQRGVKAETWLRDFTGAFRALMASIEQARGKGQQILALLANFHLGRVTHPVFAATGLPDEPP